MENSQNPEGLPERIVPREIYFTPEQIALRALVDEIDKRVMIWIKEENEQS